jgi:putative peptidoglycan lipid II flippase
MGRFFKALGPAVIGSAGVQIAIFADTIIASLLPTGAVSAISYADRLYQLPVGLIGIAAGTVLLPEMSKHLAANGADRAHAAQNRSIALTLALTAPFLVAFLAIPGEIMRGVFMHGRFTEADADASAAVLAAYAIGILPVVLIRSLVASFHARQDTTTPVLAAFIGIAVNVGLKLALYRSAGAAGLAFATAIGAWINGGMLAFLAQRRQWAAPDVALGRTALSVGVAALLLALATPELKPVAHAIASSIGRFEPTIEIAALGVGGGGLYLVALAAALKLSGARLSRLR